MTDSVRILVVEDEMIIGAKISMQLTNMGYEVTGVLPRGEEAILHADENKPDIVLLDIQLKGKLNGIETAAALQKKGDQPIIYLTANADEATFNQAKATRPYAFISKPYKPLDLQRAIELTISRMAENVNGTVAAEETDGEPAYVLSDRIFVRYKEKMIKIILADILYVEADRNYCSVFTKDKDYLLAVSLRAIEQKLPTDLFLRVHRSYLVNKAHVDEVTETQVLIDQRSIPLGDGMRDKLLKGMRTL
jgi:DNA-binding LytR/AlgR family response regulator